MNNKEIIRIDKEMRQNYSRQPKYKIPPMIHVNVKFPSEINEIMIRIVEKGFFPSRSELIRFAIVNFLIQEELFR